LGKKEDQLVDLRCLLQEGILNLEKDEFLLMNQIELMMQRSRYKISRGVLIKKRMNLK